MQPPAITLSLLLSLIANLYSTLITNFDLLLAFTALELVLIGIVLAVLPLAHYAYLCYSLAKRDYAEERLARLDAAFEAQNCTNARDTETLNKLEYRRLLRQATDDLAFADRELLEQKIEHSRLLRLANDDLAFSNRELLEQKAENDRLRQNTRDTSALLIARGDDIRELKQALDDALACLADAQQMLQQQQIDHGALEVRFKDTRSAVDVSHAHLRSQDACVVSLKKSLDATREEVIEIKEKSAREAAEAKATIRALEAELAKQKGAYNALTSQVSDAKADHATSMTALADEKLYVQSLAQKQEDALRAELEARDTELRALKAERADLEAWLNEETKAFSAKFRHSRIRSLKARFHWLFLSREEAQHDEAPSSPPTSKIPKTKTPSKPKTPNVDVATDAPLGPVKISLPLDSEASTPLKTAIVEPRRKSAPMNNLLSRLPLPTRRRAGEG